VLRDSLTRRRSNHARLFRLANRYAGNIAFVLSLITVVLATVADEIQKTAPCWRPPFAAVAAGTLISAIAALGIGVIAILAGLITLRVRTIAFGVAPFLIIGALISATIRSDGDASHVYRRIHGFRIT